MAMSEVSEALAMGVACGGRATSRTSRRVGAEKSLTDSRPRWKASPASSAAVESVVMLPVLVLVSPAVRRRRYYHQRHRPEAGYDATNCSCPKMVVVLCSAGRDAVGCTVVDWRCRRQLGVRRRGVS